MTGAGLSVASGIPDFRTPGTGVWANVDTQSVATIGVFRRDPARFWAFYRDRLDCFDRVEPNPGHYAIAALQQAGVLKALISQNIDGLHQKAGSTDVIEVHGTTRTLTCTGCDRRYRRADRDRLFDDAGVARCEDCSAAVKPDTILFGEMLPDCFTTAASEAAQADLMICAGSSTAAWSSLPATGPT